MNHKAVLVRHFESCEVNLAGEVGPEAGVAVVSVDGHRDKDLVPLHQLLEDQHTGGRVEVVVLAWSRSSSISELGGDRMRDTCTCETVLVHFGRGSSDDLRSDFAALPPEVNVCTQLGGEVGY